MPGKPSPASPVLYCKTGDAGDGFFCYRIQVYINEMFTDEEDGKGGTKE